MNEILKMVISLFVSGSIIAIILFALKCLYKNRLSETWRYYIWLIVIIHLLVSYYLQRNIVGELFYKAESYIEDKNQISKSVILNDSKTDIPSSEEIIDMGKDDTVYNQKHQGQEKSPSDYHNLIIDKEEDVVINLKNTNSYNIAESGSFQGKNGKVLNLNIESAIRGGTVDLFLFDPSGKEQRITIGFENFTKDIQLTEGLWQYNCSGIFRDGGNIAITGSIKN